MRIMSKLRSRWYLTIYGGTPTFENVSWIPEALEEEHAKGAVYYRIRKHWRKNVQAELVDYRSEVSPQIPKQPSAELIDLDISAVVDLLRFLQATPGV